MRNWRVGVVVVVAACTGRQSDTRSQISACMLDGVAAVCSAPSQVIVPSADEKHEPQIATGVTYEVAAGPGGWLVFHAPVTGTYTLYMATAKPAHVCDVIISQPTCESSVDGCAAFDEAREYTMVAGHSYEIGVPASTTESRIQLVSPSGNGMGPAITLTQAPAEGSSVGPLVQLAFTIGDYNGDLSCRLDGSPGACRPVDTTQPYHSWSFWNVLPPGGHHYEVSAADTQGNVSVVTRDWTTVCSAPTTTDAAGLLHLDGDTSNATGGPAPTFSSPPTFTSDGAYGGAAVFSAATQGSWALGLGVRSQFTISMWVNPDASTTTPQDLFVSADGRFRIRTVVDSGFHQFSFVIEQDNGTTAEFRENSATPGQWHYVLASYDGSVLHAWEDNTEYDRAATLSGADLGDVQLGGSYSGALDEVWVSTKPISDLFAGWVWACPQK